MEQHCAGWPVSAAGHCAAAAERGVGFQTEPLETLYARARRVLKSELDGASNHSCV
jgi:hypothetical protein